MGIPVLVGADPEVILRIGGEAFPCVGLIPGTKAEPFAVPDSRFGLTVQEDGVCLELGFAPVQQREIQSVVQHVYSEARTYIRTVIGPNVSYREYCYATFTPEQLMPPQARQLGCDPDQLAYAGGMRRPPFKADDLGLDRFAGGHIHIGYDRKLTPVPDEAVIQAMDLAYLTHCVAEGRDKQGARRKFYGVAGLYRKKDYGVEYRTPSNFWFTRDSGAIEFISRIARHAINRPQAYRSIWKQIQGEMGWEMIEKSINEETCHVSVDRLWWFIDQLERSSDELGDFEELENTDMLIQAEPAVLTRSEPEDDYYEEDSYDDEEEAA